MRKVVCTGMSGSGRRESLNKLVQRVPPPGCEWDLFDVGDVMFELDPQNRAGSSEKLSRDEWEEGILKRVPSLSQLRDKAHRHILAKVEEARERELRGGIERIIIISTHAVFYHDYSGLDGLERDWLDDLDPDMFITIIDDILKVRQRLRASRQLRWASTETSTLLHWRDEEYRATRKTADLLEKEHYLVPRRRVEQILYELIFHQEKNLVYISYPMTFVRDRPEIREDTSKLLRDLSETFVVFDPADIRDLETVDRLLEDIRREHALEGAELLSREETQIRAHLAGQTVARDRTLIEQSHGIVVYYPALRFEAGGFNGGSAIEESPPFSSGVLYEIFYATQLGRKVWVTWKPSRSPGPFLDSMCLTRVSSVDELLSILTNQFWDRGITEAPPSHSLISPGLVSVGDREREMHIS